MTPVMIRNRQLESLATAVRAVVGERAGWRETARLVASELERELPSPSILTPEQRAGDPERYRSQVLHAGARRKLFELDEERRCLVEAGNAVNLAGEVSGFAPPGDIHRVRNAGERTAISIHIYGTDVPRIGSSVRRHYDLPVRATRK
jgi:3-mercaptopropionate dioxygenase